MPKCIAAAALQELKTLWPDRVIIIDVRSAEEYTSMHLPGALHIPLALLESQTRHFPKNSIPITVCGHGGGRSAQAATALRQLGFKNAGHLCSGTFGWYESLKES